MFSFPVTRPQASFPAVSNVYLVLVFRPPFLPPGKGRNLAVGIEVEESFAEESAGPFGLVELARHFLVTFFPFWYTLLSTSMVFISLDRTLRNFSLVV